MNKVRNTYYTVKTLFFPLFRENSVAVLGLASARETKPQSFSYAF